MWTCYVGMGHCAGPSGLEGRCALAPAGRGGAADLQRKEYHWQCVWNGSGLHPALPPACARDLPDCSPATPLASPSGHCQAGAEMAAMQAEEGIPELICH